MAINIALGPRHDVDPHSQPIPRSFVGYDPHLGDEQLWNANRGVHDLEDAVAQEQFATFSVDGTIRLVAELEGIENVEQDGVMRRALMGRILHMGDPVRDALVGRQLPDDIGEVAHIDTDDLDAMPAAERYAVPERPRRAFLLTIDPEQWFWTPEDEQDVISRTAAGASVREVWSAGGRRQGIEPGDRVFLLQKGAGRRGVRGIGRVTSRIYQDEHWDDPRRVANYVTIDWDRVLGEDEMVFIERLQEQIPGYGWNPQKGGVELHEPMATQLEDLWADHTGDDTSAGEATAAAGWQFDDPRFRMAATLACGMLVEQYRQDGWEVVETSHDRPHCAVAYRDDQSRYLFAKGTETVGRPVLFAAQEVDHIREHPGECVIGLLSDLEFAGGRPVPGSGVLTITALDLEDGTLEPVAYRYLPRED